MDCGQPSHEYYLVSSNGTRYKLLKEYKECYVVEMPIGYNYRYGVFSKYNTGYSVTKEPVDDSSYWRKRALKAEEEIVDLKRELNKLKGGALK